MIPCNGNKILELGYDVTQHSIRLKRIFYVFIAELLISLKKQHVYITWQMTLSILPHVTFYINVFTTSGTFLYCLLCFETLSLESVMIYVECNVHYF